MTAVFFPAFLCFVLYSINPCPAKYQPPGNMLSIFFSNYNETSVSKGYKRDKIEMKVDRAETSDFPLYLNAVAGGFDYRNQTIGGVIDDSCALALEKFVKLQVSLGVNRVP